MKKVIFIMAMVMSAAVMSAQVVPPSPSPSTTPSSNDTYSKSPASSTAKTIQAADLPKAITDNINKDYPGYTIKEATSVSGKDGLNYQVEVMKGSTTETLLYNKDGKFLRKVTPKTGMKHTPKK